MPRLNVLVERSIKIETNRDNRDKRRQIETTRWGGLEVGLKTETTETTETEPSRPYHLSKYPEPELRVGIGQKRGGLSGLEKRTFQFLKDIAEGSNRLVTPPLVARDVAIHCNTTVSSIKKTIQRLVGKKFLERIEFQRGVGGWTQYKICSYPPIK